MKTREHWRVGFERGLRMPLVSPASASAHPYSEADRAIIERLRARAIVGTGAQVAATLRALADRLALDEIVINTWTFDPETRLASYALIAREFGTASS